MNKMPSADPAASTSALIDERIAALGDWRGAALAQVRRLIHDAVPDVVEEWKWNIPVWSRDGILCTGETYKQAVKLTFAKGASVPDPKKLFTSSLDGKVRRGLDIHEGETLDEAAFKRLMKAAVDVNAKAVAAKATKGKKP